jgi:hypothetical protein
MKRPIVGTAVFSDDGRYRYRLTRDLSPIAPDGVGTVNFVLLNPSTATAEVDDPTIRRCTQFACAWGYRRLVVTNLFAYRATDPAELRQVADPVGPENDWHLDCAANHVQTLLVVLAWGTHGSYLGRDKAVLALLAQHRHLYAAPPMCLGVTKAGAPRHPLYLSAGTPLQPYLQGDAQ